MHAKKLLLMTLLITLGSVNVHAMKSRVINERPKKSTIFPAACHDLISIVRVFLNPKELENLSLTSKTMLKHVDSTRPEHCTLKWSSDGIGEHLLNTVLFWRPYNNVKNLHDFLKRNSHVTQITGCIGFYSSGITAIAESCPQLRYLNLYGCKELTNNAIVTIVRNCRQLRHIECAEHPVEITEAEIVECEATINAEPNPGIQVLMRHRIKKEIEFFRYLKSIDHEPAVSANDPSPLRHLALDFENDDLITDAEIIAIVERSPLLHHINLRKRKNITDKTLIAIARHCPHLSKLEISDCPQITDIGLIAIAQGFPALKELEMGIWDHNNNNNNNITDKGIMAIAEQCHELKYIDFRGRPRRAITEKAIEFIKAKLPSCHILP